VTEFVAYVRANSGKLNCGHHGIGTGTHLACVQFARMTGTAIADISYKGAPQVNADLLANRVQLYFATLPTQLQYIRAGQMKAYGVASPERAPSAPEIPTLDEQGLKGMNMDSWNALYAPAGTPKAIVQRLNAELLRILALPEVRKRIENTGSIVRPGSAEALAKLTMEEFAAYRKLATDANIRLD
jgi:tripartite-type tricarboxylate transporter receptor subunit TctC